MGKLIQHCVIHISHHNLAKIIIKNKLTNPQIKSQPLKSIPFNVNCIRNFESCKWCDPQSAQGSTWMGRWWRAQRSTVCFTWDDTCLQKRILSDDVRSSNITDWLSDARLTAITKKQVLFTNAACLTEKYSRANEKCFRKHFSCKTNLMERKSVTLV